MADVASQLMAARMAGAQQSAALAIMKRNHEMDMLLVNMVAEAARSAPPPSGQGLVIDRRA